MHICNLYLWNFYIILSCSVGRITIPAYLVFEIIYQLRKCGGFGTAESFKYPLLACKVHIKELRDV